MSHTTIMLNGLIDLIFLNSCALTTALSISHVIAMYVQEIKMPLKCHIYTTCKLVHYHI